MAFLLQMPKGADLHNHLSGAVYAESYIEWSAKAGLCVDQRTFYLLKPPCDEPVGHLPVSMALINPVLYRQIIDAWSMRNWQFSGQNGHDHFFDAFGKFDLATIGHLGAMLAEELSRAAKGHVIYLELMLTPDKGSSSQIGQKVGWDGGFESTLLKLRANNIIEAAVRGEEILRDAETQKNRLLKCGTPEADPGCAVTVRYIFQVSRGAPLGQVYAQMVTGFMMADEPRSNVVALNLVQAEDGLSSMQNFSVEMQMLNFLHPLYPGAHITLHAGELAPGIVSPDRLSYHIRDSVEVGHAERIGHGVAIMHENNPDDLLRELARRNVMIEICLTSNDLILGIHGNQHPLATYIEYGVPVALATDDEGVSRSEISREYLKAVEEQDLGYVQLKTMARTSLQYAFISGSSLWSDAKKFIPIPRCAKENLGQAPLSKGCQQFLAGSEKARLQWELEKELTTFESQY